MTPPFFNARALRSALTLACLSGSVLSAPSAQAQLNIVPTFDTTITSSPNAAAIEAAINASCAFYAANFTNNITVTMKFATVTSGLGQSSTYYYTIGYQSFYNLLTAHATTANDALALARIAPTVSGANPVNGSTQINVTTANYRALGGAGGLPPFDGTVYLNTSIMNLNRTTIDPNKYDLQAVIYHEMNEVLGFGSALNGLANGATAPTGPISALDLFRYDQTGLRSFNTTASSQAYFSLDGLTHLERFNQSQGGDYQDFYSTGAHTPAVQDAFAMPGSNGAVNNGAAELTALDVIGYAPKVALATVTGRISLEGVGNLAAVSSYSPLGTFHVSFQTPGTGVELKGFNVALTPTAGSASGKYTVNVAPGVYDVRINGAKNLAVLVSNVTIAGTTGTVSDVRLAAGDINGDNSVDSTDFGLLIGAYGAEGSIPGSGYLPAADLNFDGFIDSTDFGLLIGEFNSSGAN